MALTETEIRRGLIYACAAEGEMPCGQYSYDPRTDVYTIPVGMVPPRVLHLRGVLVSRLGRREAGNESR